MNNYDRYLFLKASIIVLTAKIGYLSLIKQSNKGCMGVRWLVFVTMNPYKSDYHSLIIQLEWR